MHLAVSHKHDQEGARAAVDRAFEHYKNRYASYKPRLKWLDDERAELSFTAKGVTIHGSLALVPGKIVMNAKVPILLRPFTKKAVAAVEGEMTKWLGEASRSEA